MIWYLPPPSRLTFSGRPLSIRLTPITHPLRCLIIRFYAYDIGVEALIVIQCGQVFQPAPDTSLLRTFMPWWSTSYLKSTSYAATRLHAFSVSNNSSLESLLLMASAIPSAVVVLASICHFRRLCIFIASILLVLPSYNHHPLLRLPRLYRFTSTSYSTISHARRYHML